jgi:hypothetical protein
MISQFLYRRVPWSSERELNFVAGAISDKVSGH